MIQIKLFTTLLLSSVLLVQSKNQIPFKAQSMQNSNSNSNPFASSNSLPTLADILTVVSIMIYRCKDNKTDLLSSLQYRKEQHRFSLVI